ncbi:MAG: cupin domain-containing protein [Gammaproteobacteria bacterium]
MKGFKWTSLLGAALLCAATASVVPSSFAAVDAKGFTILKPDELVWQHNAEGPDFAFISGDPQKPGFYVVRARFAPGVMSKPHYHPTDRYVTVISGTWWSGTTADGDRNKTVPLGPGSFMIHPAGAVHFDGAKDVEAIVEIKGIGPAPSIPAGK